MGVRSIWSIKPKNIRQTARSIRLDASILMKEDGCIDELFPHGTQRVHVNQFLVQFCELCMKCLEFLEQNIGSKALPDQFFGESEFLGRRLALGTGLGHHLNSEQAFTLWFGQRARLFAIFATVLRFVSTRQKNLASPDLKACAGVLPIAMPPAPSIPAKRALPSKEATLFRELLSQYETRQLKKGLKNADQILKKFPEHGGTPNHTRSAFGDSNKI